MDTTRYNSIPGRSRISEPEKSQAGKVGLEDTERQSIVQGLGLHQGHKVLLRGLLGSEELREARGREGAQETADTYLNRTK